MPNIGYFYINLDNRTDRNDHMIQQFGKFNIETYHRISAIPFKPGHIGCSKSHVLAMEEFIKSDYDIGIIMEDDFEFEISPEEYQIKLNKLFSSNIEWKVVLFAGNIKQFNEYNDFLRIVIEAQTTSGYMVNKNFAQILLNNYKEGLNLYLSPGANQWTHSIDQYWKRLQGPNSQWFMFHPRCGRQMASFSDIEGRKTFYNC